MKQFTAYPKSAVTSGEVNQRRHDYTKSVLPDRGEISAAIKEYFESKCPGLFDHSIERLAMIRDGTDIKVSIYVRGSHNRGRFPDAKMVVIPTTDGYQVDDSSGRNAVHQVVYLLEETATE